MQVKKLNLHIESIKDKELKYDSQIIKFEQMENAIQDLKFTLNEKDIHLKKAINEKNSYEDRFNNLNTEIEVLKKDKK